MEIDFEADKPSRDGSRVAATAKMEGFVIMVNGFQQLTINTKHSILAVAAALDPPLPRMKAELIIMMAEL